MGEFEIMEKRIVAINSFMHFINETRTSLILIKVQTAYGQKKHMAIKISKLFDIKIPSMYTNHCTILNN